MRTRENFVTWSRGGRGSQNVCSRLILSTVSTCLMRRNDIPDPVGCITVALEYLQETRVPLYPVHRLAKPRSYVNKNRDTLKASGQKERDRRTTVRTLLEELSRYYRPPGDDRRENAWDIPSLLSESKFGLDHSSR